MVMPGGKPPAGPAPPRKASVVKQWEDYKNYNRHCDKVEQVKSSIDNSWSMRQDNKLEPSRYNAKKEQMTADRYGEIERENRRLLLKMMEIDRGGAKVDSGKASRGPSRGSSRGRSGSQPPPADRRVTPARQRELERIDAENMKLLRRIQKAKPSVSASKMDNQHAQQQKVMQMRRQNRPESQPACDRSASRGRAHEPDTWDEDFRKLCALEERLRNQVEEDDSQPAPEGNDEITIQQLIQKHSEESGLLA